MNMRKIMIRSIRSQPAAVYSPKQISSPDQRRCYKTKPCASIFQAVVNQTISGLACGKPIRGNVAFLGGPLHFLTELKEAFIRTLNLKDDEIIAPTHSHLFAAVGAALNAKEEVTTDFEHLLKQFEKKIELQQEVDRLEPLFKSEQEYKNFVKDHNRHVVKTWRSCYI